MLDKDFEIQKLMTIGFNIVPTIPNTKEPVTQRLGKDTTDRIPLTFNNVLDAMKFFDNPANEDYGLGIMMGKGYFALDFDNLFYLEPFLDNFNTEMLDKVGHKTDILDTAINITPHGIHLIYKLPKDVPDHLKVFLDNYKNVGGRNLDIISNGWYICVYPTPGYKWMLSPYRTRVLSIDELEAMYTVLNIGNELVAEDYETEADAEDYEEEIPF